MRVLITLLAALAIDITTAFGFEGCITAATTRSGNVQTLVYTVVTNLVRIDNPDTNRPHASNIMDLDTGGTIILYPHNRSFVRLKHPDPGNLGPGSDPTTATPTLLLPNSQAIQKSSTTPPGLESDRLPTAAGRAAMAVTTPLRPLRHEKIDVKLTNDTTNLLGFACTRYQLSRRAEVMDVWATDALFPFQPYIPTQPHHFGSWTLEDEWGDEMKSRKLFPLMAVSKLENGPEKMRFEVKSITSKRIKKEDAEIIFQPSVGYEEAKPLSF
jgi:hypothetical protein